MQDRRIRRGSTRTELAAGIVGICAYGPIHLGSDSKSFVDTSNEYIELIRHGEKPPKHWELISDGDLWKYWSEELRSVPWQQEQAPVTEARL